MIMSDINARIIVPCFVIRRNDISSLNQFVCFRDWVVSLIRWENRHRDYLNEKSYKEDAKHYWFTDKMIRRSFIIIRRVLPNIFHYLSNSNIPKSTNLLESFFGHLKQKISLHRGLPKSHCVNFWCGIFTSTTTPSPPKKNYYHTKKSRSSVGGLRDFLPPYRQNYQPLLSNLLYYSDLNTIKRILLK